MRGQEAVKKLSFHNFLVDFEFFSSSTSLLARLVREVAYGVISYRVPPPFTVPPVPP
jgi:hypothetical protein